MSENQSDSSGRTKKPKLVRKVRRHRRIPSPDVVIEVPRDQIAHAVQRDSSHCMIAESIKAAIPDAKNVSVDLQTIRWTDEKKHYRYVYLTPRAAQAALIDFDQGVLPEPFSIKLQRAQVTVANKGSGARKKARAALKKGAMDFASEGGGAPKSDAAKSIALESIASDRGTPLGRRRLQRFGDRVPQVIGGQPPPTGALNVKFSDRQPTDEQGQPLGREYTVISRRREFGLRALRP